PALERLRRVAGRHTHEQRLLAALAELVPDLRLLHRAGMGEREALVRRVLAVAHPVDGELAGRLPRHRTRPRGNGDRRRDRLELAVHPAFEERVDVRDLSREVVEQETWRGAIQPDYRHAHIVRHAVAYLTGLVTKRSVALAA